MAARRRRTPRHVASSAAVGGVLAFGFGTLIAFVYGTKDAFFGETNSATTRGVAWAVFVVGCAALGAAPAITWWYSRSRAALVAAVVLMVTPIAVALVIEAG